MYSVFLLIGLFLLLFVSLNRYNLREGLTNKNTIILLGDSVLNNSKYVLKEQTVEAQIKLLSSNVYNFSKDGAKINDLYHQLDKIPYELNKDTNHVFISIGGNDILELNNNLSIKELFNSLKEFLKSLRTKLPDIKINMLNIYLPSDPRYKKFSKSIDEWNQLLQTNSNTIGDTYNIIDLHSMLTTPDDFVYAIEPSAIASQKIANTIYLS